MDQAELLQQLNEKLDQYKKFQGYIDRAKAQGGKFSPAVIEKVCLDNEVKMMEVADEIRPLLPDLESRAAEFRTQLQEQGADPNGSSEALEELDLRLAIGEISDEEYEAESEGLKSQVAEAQEAGDLIQSQLDEVDAVLNRWAELSGQALESEGDPAPEAEVVGEPEGEDNEDQEDEPDSPEQAEVVVEGEPEEEAADDEALVLEDSINELDAAEEDDSGDDQEPIIEADSDPIVEASLDDFPGGGNEPIVSGGFGEERLGDAFGFDPESAVPGEGEGPLASEEIERGLSSTAQELEEPEAGEQEDKSEPILELHGKEEPGMENGADDGARRALLLYQEGTQEEQSYPFTGDEITIGRGRDNDIQIKNDSKVSRKHCRLFRKEGAFYIQDNKSSNGSLVNGELITERRLFGGEEVIVGETFFRFRIMD